MEIKINKEYRKIIVDKIFFIVAIPIRIIFYPLIQLLVLYGHINKNYNSTGLAFFGVCIFLLFHEINISTEIFISASVIIMIFYHRWIFVVLGFLFLKICGLYFNTILPYVINSLVDLLPNLLIVVIINTYLIIVGILILCVVIYLVSKIFVYLYENYKKILEILFKPIGFTIVVISSLVDFLIELWLDILYFSTNNIKLSIGIIFVFTLIVYFI